MRPAVGLSLCIGLLVAAWLAVPRDASAEYFCSPGFAPVRGRCIATVSRDEIDLVEVDSGDRALHHRRFRHRGLRTLY